MFVDVLYKNIYNCQYFSQLGYTIGKVSVFSSSFSVAQFSLWQKYNYYNKTNDISSHILKGNISCFNISSFNYSRFEEMSLLVKVAIFKKEWVVRCKFAMSYLMISPIKFLVF